MEVILSSQAEKQYNKLSKSSQTKIKQKLLALMDDPHLGKKLVGDMTGIRSLRAWPHRILYEINISKKRIEILKIAHRQGAYK